MDLLLIVLSCLLGLVTLFVNVYLVCDVLNLIKNQKYKWFKLFLIAIGLIIVLCLPPLVYFVHNIGVILFYLTIILLLIKFIIKPLIHKSFIKSKLGNNKNLVDNDTISTDDIPNIKECELEIENSIMSENGDDSVVQKVYFCKMCGGKINTDKKCTKCGKQYFKITYSFITIVCLIVITIVVSTFLGIQIKNNLKLKNEIINITKEKETIQAESKTWKDKYYKTLFENIDKENFMDEHVVIVSNDGTNKYHKYGCEQLNLSYFWVYNTEAAIDEGFVMCKKCN